MRLPLCCGLLLAALASAFPALSAVPAPVTVLLSFENPHSRPSFEAIERQLQHALVSTGLKLDVRDRASVAPHEEFADLVMFKMRGNCSMQAGPARVSSVNTFSAERGALAMAYSSDGSVLSFGAVECDHVRESLRRLLGSSHHEQYDSAYGAALGLVMAHEIYHMRANSLAHTKGGFTKESLSARELLDGKLSLPAIARFAIQGLPARPK